MLYMFCLLCIILYSCSGHFNKRFTYLLTINMEELILPPHNISRRHDIQCKHNSKYKTGTKFSNISLTTFSSNVEVMPPIICKYWTRTVHLIYCQHRLVKSDWFIVKIYINLTITTNHIYVYNIHCR